MFHQCCCVLLVDRKAGDKVVAMMVLVMLEVCRLGVSEDPDLVKTW